MARGDHIRIRRVGYYHHAIDCGDGTVLHYAPGNGQYGKVQVQRSDFKDFALGGHVEVVHYARCDHPDTVMARAFGRIWEERYSVFFNNCEHFACWCKTGVHASDQVRRATAVAGGSAGAGASTASGLGAVGAVGAAAGLSGAASTMSGLATAGSLVGGGAVAGLTVLAAAPAASAAFAMQHLYPDDPYLPAHERGARAVGRTVALAGAGGGVGLSVGAVSAVGVPGLSAAGITSGLAGIGGTVGGGMLAGAALTALAPAALALGLAFLGYRLAGGGRGHPHRSEWHPIRALPPGT